MCTLQQDLDRLRRRGGADGHAHLDALQRILQLPAVQQVVEALGRSAKACPVVDDAFALLFVLAMGLFPTKSYRNVARRLTPAGRADGLPSRATLAAARRRLGAEPVRALIQGGLPPLADAAVPDAFHGGLRLMSIGGFSLAVP